MYKIAMCSEDETYCVFLEEALNYIAAKQMILYRYHSTLELLSAADEKHDLIFMDHNVKMAHEPDTAHYLSRVNSEAVFVICLEMQCPVPDSMRNGSYLYLRKRFSREKTIEDLKTIFLLLTKNPKRRHIWAYYKREWVKVEVDYILYVSVRKHGCTLTLIHKEESKGELCSSEHLAVMYQQLKDYGFAYAHNSYIVNLKQVTKYKHNAVELTGGTELNISRSHKKGFHRELGEFMHKNHH